MVCDICARYSEKQAPEPERSSIDRPASAQSREKRIFPKERERLELREDFAKVIRDAREQLNWTQKDLADYLLERLSTVRRIESGTLEPDEKLIDKIEKGLGISLRVTTSDIPEIKMETKLPSDITLGDVVHLKTKKKKSEE
jgi:putative transcription factor